MRVRVRVCVSALASIVQTAVWDVIALISRNSIYHNIWENKRENVKERYGVRTSLMLHVFQIYKNGMCSRPPCALSLVDNRPKAGSDS